MVSFKQISIPAIILLGLAEQAAAAPLAPVADIDVRDVNGALDSVTFDLVARALYGDDPDVDLVARALYDEDIDLNLAVRAMYDDDVDLETRAAVFSALKALPNAFKGISKIKNILPGSNALKKVVTAGVKAKNGVKKLATKAANSKHKGKTYDRLLSTANTAMTVANTKKALAPAKKTAEPNKKAAVKKAAPKKAAPKKAAPAKNAKKN